MSEKMTKEQKEYFEVLKKRDEPMPMGKYFWQSDKFKDDPPADTCGNCGRFISCDDYVFCPVCGQRIDTENYKL